ncbi:MAG: 1-deoxy-D-xylulose-5-phosphate reductoisomerase, partial [Vibrionaceae bacterium]
IYQVFALTANNNCAQMLALCLEFRPQLVAMADPAAAKLLQTQLRSHDCGTRVLSGSAGVCELAGHPQSDVVMAAIVGAAGLYPTMEAVKAGKRILLANKEALVMSGQLFLDALVRYGATLLPVDSEHNAIFQCLPPALQDIAAQGKLAEHGISNILLTGSGGPFRYTPLEHLSAVTPEQALAHPNWSMGAKVSIDSATMMNKGLEYIEARWLFNASKDEIEVIIHPQSIIHSMVQYCDGSVLAQMGEPSMCTPIAHALAYPKRVVAGVKALDFTKISQLTFLEPDYSRYPCLKLAMDACDAGQAATTCLNAANEVAVHAFLQQKIRFTQISQICEQVLALQTNKEPYSIDDLLDIDSAARRQANQIIKGIL